MIQNIVSVVFILLISAACIGSGQRKESSDRIIISRSTSAALKGIAILLVFTHHYWQLTSFAYNSHTFIGYIGVTIFMLVAGYVSEVSLRDKGEESLTNWFFIKKFVRLYVPYICVKLILGFMQHKSLHNIIAAIVHIEDDWFLCAITVMYILFYLTSKSSYRQLNQLMLGGIVLYITICAILGLPSVWYNTSIAFYIGMAASHKGWLFCRQRITLIVSGVAALLLGILTATRLLSPEIISTVFSVCLAIFLVCLLQEYSIQNRMLAWVGKISWEFYLFQSTVLVIIGKRITNNYVLYFMTALLVSIALGYAVNKMIGFLTERIKQKFLRKNYDANL